MAKEKVNYQEVYDLYQLCSETKDLREFCADYGVNYDKFMNWQRHQLWNEKLGKTVQVEQPKVAKVQISGKVVFHRVCLKQICLRSDETELMDNFISSVKIIILGPSDISSDVTIM